MVIVLMGPAGAGKSTVGAALAARLRCAFVDADDHHPVANLSRLERGEPLTDGDREGWLDTLHAIIARAIDRRETLVLACSALAARHRARLVGALRPVRVVYLKAEPEVLHERLVQRRGHVAPPQLLASQLATLEEPAIEEALTVDGAADVETIIGHIRLELGV